MSDSDDEPTNPYVDFRDRPEWKGAWKGDCYLHAEFLYPADVVPVTIDESHNPLCPIAYTAQCMPLVLDLWSFAVCPGVSCVS
jgi:hypothetical protein